MISVQETRFFVDLGLLIAGALAGGLLAHGLRQPLIVGYILGGILVGPFTPGPTISDPHTFRLFAEIGVILLMFSAGVEFSIGQLLQVGKVGLLGAPAGLALIVLLTVPAGRLLGWPLTQSLVAGAAISVASTMVILKFLLERRELTAPHGRVIVAITLMEDLLVVALTVVLPALGAAEERLVAFGRGLLLAVAILAPVLWAARRVMPGLLLRVARTGNMELFFLVTIAAATGTAGLTARLGLSVALGAFLAGLVVSESEVAHEALARLVPMRDVFVAAFFVSIGAAVHPAALLGEIPTVAVLILLVTAGKFLVWTGVVRFLGGYGPRTAMLAALGLTQIGEFSYVLAGLGVAHGLMAPAAFNAILATSVLTILINAVVFRRMPRWLQRLLERPRGLAPASAWDAPADARVLICGFGRVGRRVADALDLFAIPYAVIDLDPDAVQAARVRGATAVFGDAGNDLILERAGAARAPLAVVAVPSTEAARRCVGALRRMRRDLPIIARVHQADQGDLLAQAGATEVVQPEIEAALTMVRHTLVRLGIDPARVTEYLEEARRHRRAAPEEGHAGGTDGSAAR